MKNEDIQELANMVLGINSEVGEIKGQVTRLRKSVDGELDEFLELQKNEQKLLSEAVESSVSAISAKVEESCAESISKAEKASESAQKTLRRCAWMLVFFALCTVVLTFGCWYWTQQCIAQLEAANEAFTAAVQMAQAVEVELTPPETVTVNPISEFFTTLYTILGGCVLVFFLALAIAWIKDHRR